MTFFAPESTFNPMNHFYCKWINTDNQNLIKELLFADRNHFVLKRNGHFFSMDHNWPDQPVTLEKNGSFFNSNQYFQMYHPLHWKLVSFSLTIKRFLFYS